MEPMQSLASSYISLPVTLVSNQSFLEPQAEPEHQIAHPTNVRASPSSQLSFVVWLKIRLFHDSVIVCRKLGTRPVRAGGDVSNKYMLFICGKYPD